MRIYNFVVDDIERILSLFLMHAAYESLIVSIQRKNKFQFIYLLGRWGESSIWRESNISEVGGLHKKNWC